MEDWIGGSLGVIFIFCLAFFTSKALINSQLKINPNQKDGFLFRLKAARIPIILLGLFIAAIYGVFVLGYIVDPKARSTVFNGMGTINMRVLIVASIALLAIFYNIFNYKRS